jgi:aliphatic nitrilase
MQKGLRGGCLTAIISPEGSHLVPPLREGEGVLIADLDMSLIVKRKRMMDSVGHYARPELLSLTLDNRATSPMTSSYLHPVGSFSHDLSEPEHTGPSDHGPAIVRVAAG